MNYLKLITGVFLISSFSCVKKIEEVNHLNTNIFDEEYEGGQWFEVVDYYKFYNSSGQLRAKFEVAIPKENFPDLKPTKVDIATNLNGQGYEYNSASLTSNGDYEFEKIYPTVPSGEYCLEIGLFNEEDNRILNSFTECINL